MIKITLAFIFALFTFSVLAKVEAYNYNFSLNILDEFSPEKIITDIEKKYKPHITISSKGEYKIQKYLVSEQRYIFPIFVQYHKDKVVDFYVRLPSYFIHDIFHESLIKKLGKQDKYSKYEESASYYWKNINGSKHYYRAECTITCFPISYSVVVNKSDLPNYKPIIKQMTTESSWE